MRECENAEFSDDCFCINIYFDVILKMAFFNHTFIYLATF